MRSHGWDETCGGGPEIEVPDVLGALRGLRVWKMSEDGYLHGVTYPERWEPGENEARCLVFRSDEDKRVLMSYSLFAEVPYQINERGRVEPREGFSIGHGCPGVARGNHGCGFFAKHGARLRVSGYNGPVTGVVEMYGQVELGPEGLRSSKARIVALVRPDPTPEETATIAKWLDEARSVLAQAPRVPTWAYALLWIKEVREAFMTRREKIRELSHAIRDAEEVLESYDRLVSRFETETRRIYGVPVYDSVDEMLKAHPVADLTYMVREGDE